MSLGIRGLPGAYLVLELTNRCQLRCIHCIQSRRELSPHYGRLGEMSEEMVDALLSDIARHDIRFDALILFWLGEPLLHPRFREIYRTILEANRAHRLFRTVEVHTNGQRATAEIAEAVFAYPDVRQKWHFTLDAATAETYRAIKQVDAFAAAEEGALRFARAKGEARGAGVQLVFQFVVHDENEHEAEAFRDRWIGFMRRAGLACGVAAPHPPHDGSDAVFFRLLDSLEPERQPRADATYARVLARLGLERTAAYGAGARSGAACSGPFKSPTIDWDGSVTVCTRDSGLVNRAGDLAREPFHAIWLGSGGIERMRDAMVRRDLAAYPFCAGCPIPRSANYTGITVEEVEAWLAERRSARPPASEVATQP